MIETTNLDINIMTQFGICETLLGSLDLTKGRVLKGTKALFVGMTSANLGGRFQGLDPTSHSKLMKCVLGAGTGAVAAQGAFRLARGVKQKSVAEIVKGCIQTVAGIEGTAFVYSMDSRIIVIAHQASVLALSSCFIAKLGFYDLVKGRYWPGLCKIVLGIGGIATTGYYVYSAYIHQKSLLSADRIAFLETHKAEIEEMYEYKKASGNWKELGEGVSKKAFTHENLSSILIKIPTRIYGFRGTTGEDDLRLHHANLEQIRSIAASFDRIVLPESHLYPTSKGLMIVEQRFDLSKYSDVPDGPDKAEAMKQFDAFQRATGLCDLYLVDHHNSGIIAQTTPTKIGIIDFDCRNPIPAKLGLNHQKWDWNFRNPGSQFFNTGNRNQISALCLAAGTAILGGAAVVAKKIVKISPRLILWSGFGGGIAMAVLVPFYIVATIQPAATINAASIGMAVTAIAITVITGVGKACSWVTRAVLKRVAPQGVSVERGGLEGDHIVLRGMPQSSP